MSIVALERVTFAGLTSEKERLLDDLHRFGCLEIIPCDQPGATPVHDGPSGPARDALKFLLSSPHRRRQIRDPERFDADAVERKALQLQSQLQTLHEERDDLIQRLELVRPFGKFRFASIEEMGDLRLWFYVVPHDQMSGVESALSESTSNNNSAWQTVNRDARFCYVAVVSIDEPIDIPVPRVRIGSRSPDELAKRRDDVEFAIEDVQAERISLTRWCLLFARSLTELEDAAARRQAAGQTLDADPVFALQAWVPSDRVDELAEYAKQKGILFEHRPPVQGERPPTLMRNMSQTEAGEDLVNFYMTPGYWTWDPSGVVFVSFAIFFAMILADAGYALLLGVGLLAIWRRLGRPPQGDGAWIAASDIEQGEPELQRSMGQRFRPMLLLIVVVSLIYGVLVGSYFGVSPSTDSLLGRFNVLDMGNSQLMMGVSVLVGGLHVILANLMDARRYVDWRDGLPSLGWAMAVGGGLVAGAGYAMPQLGVLTTFGGGLVVIGLLVVVGFTARHEKPVRRLVGGLIGLTKISAAFGDVLSYLRLFALGLASASLATAFNDMAAGLHGSFPRLGLLFALLVLLFGHALNLLLGVSSGVIHGLRLNVIEFFNWGLKDEGRRFTPFRRKEGSLWN
ncbi:V-type ATP synthase subunit I [Crateriforma spongiae]|uniref:V-type ATP synthase subunit I n=1 Tax=Crateriforma spongiae TaxID=2724528 RepID=UPI0039B0C743